MASRRQRPQTWRRQDGVPGMRERYVIHDPDRGWFADWSWKGGRKRPRWCATRDNLNLFRFFWDHPSAVAALAELHRLGATKARIEEI
jgi:hypothetical protein